MYTQCQSRRFSPDCWYEAAYCAQQCPCVHSPVDGSSQCGFGLVGCLEIQRRWIADPCRYHNLVQALTCSARYCMPLHPCSIRINFSRSVMFSFLSMQVCFWGEIRKAGLMKRKKLEILCSNHRECPPNNKIQTHLHDFSEITVVHDFQHCQPWPVFKANAQ